MLKHPALIKCPSGTPQFKTPENLSAIALGITQADGTENHEVVYCSPDDKKDLMDIQRKIEKLMGENPRLGLFAASQAILKTLESGKNRNGSK